MCDISWAITIARVRRSTSVTRPRGRSSSRKVTQPGFSIAPQLRLGHEDLVVGVERERLVEQLGVVVEALLGDPAQLVEVAVQLGGQRPARVPAHREAARARRSRECHGPAHSTNRSTGIGGVVANSQASACVPAHLEATGLLDSTVQAGSATTAQRDRRLEVDLVEAGEDPLGDVDADVGADVALAVGRVGERVHPVAVGDVGQPRLDDDLVARRPQPGRARSGGRRTPASTAAPLTVDRDVLARGAARGRSPGRSTRTARSPGCRSVCSSVRSISRS